MTDIASTDVISRKRDIVYRLVAHTQPLWYEWGNAEALVIGSRLRATAIDKPVYVTGLARAGTTILLELLASHPQAASHRYKDFPFLPMIYTWRRYLQAFAKQGATPPQERSHRDGLYVTADSPEAFEEMLWMHFFPGCHDENKSAVLDPHTDNPAFAGFYRNHVRALLLVENASRYVAKGNYHIARLAYIQKLFPDARFIIAIRHPLAHIASLMKQHAWFCRLQQHNPAMLRYMQQAGHFEFGLDRRIICLHDGDAAGAVRQAWSNGLEAEGWAHYWNDIYGYAATLLANDPALAASTQVISHESLCREPEKTLRNIFSHCDLGLGDALAERWKGQLHFPGYYQPEFTPDERQCIRQITERTAGYFGYEF